MPIENLDPAGAHAAMQSGAPHVFLDVRTPAEFAGGHPAGATNVPWALPDPASGMMAPNPAFLAEVRRIAPPERRIFVSCQSGGRSMGACRDLAQAGYADLVNVAGGFGGGRDAYGRPITGWRDAGLPVER